MGYTRNYYSNQNRATQAQRPMTSQIVMPREGVVKNATYRIKNDAGVYDTVYFTTSAEQVIESDTQQFVSADKKLQYDENTIYNNPMATVNALGGIAAGTSFNNVPVSEVLDKLLYPYVAPTVSATSTPNGGINDAQGSNITVTNIRATVSKKSEKITSVTVYDGSTVLGTKTGAEVENGGTFDFQVNVSVSRTANKSFKVEVVDAANKTYTANTPAFEFIHPYLHRVVNTTDLVVDDLLLASATKILQKKGDKTITYNTNNQRAVFAYPASYGALSKIVDPNGFDVTGTFGRTTVTLSGRGIEYYVYENSAFTATGFKFTFKV